ncbi:Uncharacterized protein Rs2_38989 [Raphanus sativus]|nr:Uncharacterized protein Rs2_38989 [Raphanus sativus]
MSLLHVKVSLNQQKQRLISGTQHLRKSPLYLLENLLVSPPPFSVVIEPEFVIDYIQTLRSSEKSLKEEVVIWLISFVFFTSFFLQLEIAQMKDGSQPSNPSYLQQDLSEYSSTWTEAS